MESAMSFQSPVPASPTPATAIALPLPANSIDFDRLYSTHEDCRDILIKARWPNGFICPSCQNTKGYIRSKRPLIECSLCGYQASATAGTILHSRKLSLPTIFKLLYMVMATKNGISTMELARQAGVTYLTAMLWRRKLRDAISHREQRTLEGVVEVDETMIGGPAPGYRGRSLGENQAMVLVLVEDAGAAGLGRVRLKAIERADSTTLKQAITENVAKEATLRTDGWAGYASVATEAAAGHEVCIAQTPAAASEELPLVHRVASLLKRQILGIFHGSWTHEHLQSLLDEFAFRFNRRRSKARPLLFNRVMESGLRQRGPTRRMLWGKDVQGLQGVAFPTGVW